MMRAPLFMCVRAARGGDHSAPDVDFDEAIHFRQRGFFERFGNGGAGVIDQHVEAAKFGRGFGDGVLDGGGVSGVSLDGYGFAAGTFDSADDEGGGFSAL